MRVTFDELPKRWRCTVPPTAEPLHRDEAKSQCSLLADQTDWDRDFDRWIAAARGYFEDLAEVALLTQTWELTLPRFPSGREPIELYRPPVQAILDVWFLDTAGELQDLEDYRTALGLFPALVYPARNACWPATDCSPAAVTITFRTGFATPSTAEADTEVLTPSPMIFSNGDSLRVMNSGGALPGGLTARTEYFVRDATSTGLKLAATSGGAALPLSTDGTGQLLLGEVPDTALTALRLQVAHWFKHREAVVSGTNAPLEHAFEALARNLRWRA